MSISLLTNQAATVATNNMALVSENLKRSLNRLSSGSKIASPADDAGGLAVSMKMTAAIKRHNAIANNLSNANSYLQTQDGALATAGKILDRIGELKMLASDVTKNSTDRSNYNTEFTSLQEQLNALAAEKFNGLDLFGTTDLSVGTSADGGSEAVQLDAIDLLGTSLIPFTPISDSFSDLSNFSDQSAGTASASVVANKLQLDTGNNDLAQVDTNTSLSGVWELNVEFDKTGVVNDTLKIFLGGAEVYSYSATDTSNHSLRIVFDGTSSADIYLDGAASPTETRTGIGANSGALRFQLSSTVPGASANIDNLSVASSVAGNGVGTIAAASSLDALTVGTVTSALQDVGTFRAQNGAQQSRLQFAREQTQTNALNLEAANSRIIDVDVATESTQLARFNILQQAGAAMLQQANAAQQVAMKLLG